MMKQVFILFAISGLFSINTVIGQDNPGNYGKRQVTKGDNFNEVIVDTIISSPYGTTRFFSYSFSTNEDSGTDGAKSSVRGFSPSALRELEENQEQVLRQVGEDANRFQQWLDQQVILRNERVKQYWKQQKEALFIEIMELTTDEANRFWPLYNEFSEKKEIISSKRQAVNNTLRKANLYNIKEKDAETLSKEYIDLLAQETNLQQEYYKKYKAVLGPVKVLMIYKAEDAFKLMMLRHREQGFDF